MTRSKNGCQRKKDSTSNQRNTNVFESKKKQHGRKENHTKKSWIERKVRNKMGKEGESPPELSPGSRRTAGRIKPPKQSVTPSKILAITET